jgi:DNA-binding NarL/FixJ family response regulator
MVWKILVVDDHEAARVGVSFLLERCGFSVSGSVSTGGEAAKLLETDHFDAVLIDVRLEDGDGLGILESIRESHGDLPVIILSAYDNPTYIARAAAIGANDYVLKNGLSGVIETSLKRAIDRADPPEQSPLRKIRHLMSSKADTSKMRGDVPLTGRESQVLLHLALGLSNKDIARSLSISVETVKEHVQNILRKINANDRTDAAVRAIRFGILDRLQTA